MTRVIDVYRLIGEPYGFSQRPNIDPNPGQKSYSAKQDEGSVALGEFTSAPIRMTLSIFFTSDVKSNLTYR
jgi:hypothetical protein